MRIAFLPLLALALLLGTTACKKGGQQTENTDTTAGAATPAAATPAAAVGASGYKSLLENWAPEGFTKSSDYFSEAVHPNYTTNLFPAGSGSGVSSIIVVVTQYSASETTEAPDYRSLEQAKKFFTDGQATAQIQNAREEDIAGTKVMFLPIMGISDGTARKSNTLFVRALRQGPNGYFTIQCAVTRSSDATDWAAAESVGRKTMEYVLGLNVQ